MSGLQETLPLRAHAKLNLTLDVLARREDGYHELDSLMLRVTLHDTLLFTPANDTLVRYHNVAAPEHDVVRRAIESYAAMAGTRCKAHVKVLKRVPMEAGLGGGSADAAAVLLAMQQSYRALDEPMMRELALRLGADVPFCMQTHPCRAKGIGERLEKLAMRSPLWFLIVKPKAGISTAALFSSLRLPVRHPHTGRACIALTQGDRRALGGLMHNALEAQAVSLLPQIGALGDRLMSTHAYGACMTGSGSAVCALYPDREAAWNAAQICHDVAFYTVTRSLPIDKT